MGRMLELIAVLPIIICVLTIVGLIGGAIGGAIYGLIWGTKAIINNCNPSTGYARMGVSYQSNVAIQCVNSTCYYPGGCIFNATVNSMIVPITYDDTCQLFECTADSHKLFVWGIVVVVIISVVCCGVGTLIKDILELLAKIIRAMCSCCNNCNVTIVNPSYKCEEKETFELDGERV